MHLPDGTILPHLMPPSTNLTSSFFLFWRNTQNRPPGSPEAHGCCINDFSIHNRQSRSGITLHQRSPLLRKSLGQKRPHLALRLRDTTSLSLFQEAAGNGSGGDRLFSLFLVRCIRTIWQLSAGNDQSPLGTAAARFFIVVSCRALGTFPPVVVQVSSWN